MLRFGIGDKAVKCIVGGGVKAKSVQVPDMFPKGFPIAPPFYPICFDKCCPPFTYTPGPKGLGLKTLDMKMEPSLYGSHDSLSFSCVIGQFDLQKKRI